MVNLARFDLVTLDLFVAIARTGSITRGAQQSHLAVAAASKRISDLESHLDAVLLLRHAGGVTLTDAGHIFIQHVQDIIRGVERMSGAISDYTAGTHGRVRIWANTSAITQFLPDDLSRFLGSHPGIRIDLEECNSCEVVTALEENRADIGIFDDSTPSENIRVFDYRKDRLVLIVPKNHPLTIRKSVTLSDALDYNFVSLSKTTSIAGRLLAESKRLEKSLKLRIRVRSFDAVCRMVMAEMGIGVLPHLAAEPHVRSMGLKLIQLEDPWAKRCLLLGVQSTLALPAPVHLLASSLSTDAAEVLSHVT